MLYVCQYCNQLLLIRLYILPSGITNRAFLVIDRRMLLTSMAGCLYFVYLYIYHNQNVLARLQLLLPTLFVTEEQGT
jgi:hypothetical protein